MDKSRVPKGGVAVFPGLVGTRPATHLDCTNWLDMPIRIRRFLAKQYSDIELNKKEYLAKKGVRVLKGALALIVVISVWPIAVILVAISPFSQTRFGFLFCDRIGHYVFDAGYQLAEAVKCQKRFGFGDFFFSKGPVCNEFLKSVIDRRVKQSALSRYFFLASFLVPFGKRIRVYPARIRNGSRDPEGLMKSSDQRFEFLPEEDRLGFDYLKRQGWSEGEPYACLIVRDSAYLDSMKPDQAWDYHAYRDTNIEDYRQAMEGLVDRGYWIFRMGAQVSAKFGSSNPKIIDYVNTAEQCEALDVWLTANCQLCVSTSTGLDSIADVYFRPTIFLNFLPLAYFQTWSNCVLAPSHLLWKDTGKALGCKDHLRHAYLREEDYDAAGILVRPLSPREITSVTLAAERRLVQRPAVRPLISTDQKRFWELYARYQNSVPRPQWINPDAEISSEFLKFSPEFLD